MSVTVYTRLDKYLAENGYAGSRERARGLIESGKVMVNGQIITTASFPMVDTFTLKLLVQDHPWVSRGGPKLDAALQAFKVNPGGRVAIDVGAATGGFTDVLLGRNAKHVYCVDTGTAQLHEKIRGDARVTAWEQCDARTLEPDMFPEKYTLIVADVSFISLTKALPRVMDMAPEGADLIAVIMPQFELDGPEQIGKGGIVSDPILQKEACLRVETWLRDEMKWTIKGFLPPPPDASDPAPDGNKEFIVHAVK